MKFDIPKDWIERKAKEEAACPSVQAGAGPMIPTREQWLERCAAVLRTKGCLDGPTALDVARSQLENCNDDLTESPEEAAEDEMSNWTAD
mgnify:CR=1 FL=1